MNQETQTAICNVLVLTFLLHKFGGDQDDYLTPEQVAKVDTYGSLRDIIGGELRRQAEMLT